MLERMGTMNNMQLCGAVFAMGMLNLYNGELLEALMAVRNGWQWWCAYLWCVTHPLNAVA